MEVIDSNSSWIRAKEDVIIKAERGGSASETKDDGCQDLDLCSDAGLENLVEQSMTTRCNPDEVPARGPGTLGAPAWGRALVSDPPGTLGAPTWGRALVSDPPLLRKVPAGDHPTPLSLTKSSRSLSRLCPQLLEEFELLSIV